MEKFWTFFKIKFQRMGIGTNMGIEVKEGVRAYKNGNAASFAFGIKNIFILKVKI